MYDGLGSNIRLIADLDNDGEDQSDQVTQYFFTDDHDASLKTKTVYPDFVNEDWDSIRITYYLDGRINTRSAQKSQSGDTANEITVEYDGLRRLAKQRVTQVGTGVDDSVLSIHTAYDSMGCVESITSYSDDNTTNAVNEVRREYNGLGYLVKEYQEHSGSKDYNTSCVEYSYDNSDSDADGIFDKAMRLKSIKYPNAREVYYLYVDAGDTSGIGDKLSRITAIASASTRGQNDVNVLSSYAYNGRAFVVVEDFNQPQIRLDYWGQTAGVYTGFDRFGRVVQQLWHDYDSTPEDVDKYGYGYDENDSRLYRENILTSSFDEIYSYDRLNRLTCFSRGDLNVAKDAITNKTRGEVWGLSKVGNWNTYQIDQDGDGAYAGANDLDQSRSSNSVNEITDILEQVTPQQQQWYTPGYEARGNMTEVPKPGDLENNYDCEYDSWNRLVKVKDGQNLVAQYEYDGLNRRIRKCMDTDETAGLDTYEHFFYNIAWQLLETRSSNTASDQAENIQPEYQYVRSIRSVDALVLRDENTDVDGQCDDCRYYYTTDANMNVTGLFDVSGDPVERYAYDAYGHSYSYSDSWGSPGMTLNNSVRFCGYMYDFESGIYHVRNRYYHPLVGQWLSRDPAQYLDGMNLLGYVASMPTIATDPEGLSLTVAPIQFGTEVADLKYFFLGLDSDHGYHHDEYIPWVELMYLGCTDFSKYDPYRYELVSSYMAVHTVKDCKSCPVTAPYSITVTLDETYEPFGTIEVTLNGYWNDGYFAPFDAEGIIQQIVLRHEMRHVEYRLKYCVPIHVHVETGACQDVENKDAMERLIDFLKKSLKKEAENKMLSEKKKIDGRVGAADRMLDMADRIPVKEEIYRALKPIYDLYYR